MSGWGLQPPLQTADETGQIGTLSPIKGMQLIHHQIAQGIGLLMGPQRRVLRPDQQEIQHLVVGQQDVWRILAQNGPVGDERIGAIFQLLDLVGCGAAICRVGLGIATHIQAGPNA